MLASAGTMTWSAAALMQGSSEGRQGEDSQGKGAEGLTK